MRALFLKGQVSTLLIIGARATKKEKRKTQKRLPRARPAIKNKAVVVLVNSFLKYWIPLYVYAGLIFYFSSIPKPLPPIHIPQFDKLMHIVEYSVFGYLAARALKNSAKKAFFENFKILAVLISVLYGISDEFHQMFISERNVSVFDVMADAVGGALGVFIYGRYHPF